MNPQFDPISTNVSEVHISEYEPALDVLLPIALAAYPESERRREVIEKRLQDVLAFDIALTTALIAIGAGKDARFNSVYFVAAIACWSIGVLAGMATRLYGGLHLQHVSRLYKLAHHDVVQLKRHIVDKAGKDADKNALGTLRKSWATCAIIPIFVAEIVCLILWLAQGGTS